MTIGEALVVIAAITGVVCLVVTGHEGAAIGLTMFGAIIVFGRRVLDE